MNNIQKLWAWGSNIGISQELNNIEQVKTRVMNQAIMIVSPIQLFFNAVFASNLDLLNTIIGSLISLLLLGLMWLNSKHKFEASRLILNIIFPLIMFSTGVACGEKTGLEYNLIIFVVTAFFFHKNIWLKYSLVIYNLLLFFVLIKYWETYTSPYEALVPFLFPYFSFFITVITIIAFIQRFLVEMIKSSKQNEALLKSLEYNNKELTNANEALERFAYVASHDLKTPLRTILGFTQLLERDYDNNKTERLPMYITQVKQGAKQMNELIKNTLEYSRINHIEEEKTWINLNEIIANIHTAYITDKTVEINTTNLPKIFGEENQLLSLFQNLIENGIKYNNKPIKKIEISYVEQPHSTRIIVKDNGIGISKKFHNQIFTMFKRLHTKQQYEGTGLGLAICEKIVERMNGQISLDSVEGEGTTFYIDLPKN